MRVASHMIKCPKCRHVFERDGRQEATEHLVTMRMSTEAMTSAPRNRGTPTLTLKQILYTRELPGLIGQRLQFE
jgi:phage FluMu protein Com